MKSSRLHRTALACAALAGLCVPSQAGTPAGAEPAVAATYEGTLILHVVVDNQTGAPADANLICSATLGSTGSGASARYSAPARVTASAVSCSFRLPYRVETTDPSRTYVYAGVTIANPTATSASPSPRGVGFVRLNSTYVPLPANGAVTTRYLSGVI